MAAKSRWFVVVALFTMALIGFFTGRTVEERAVAANARANPRGSASPSPATEPAPPPYRQLAVAEILGLPFADFYEALRSAPAEARGKWASELVAMPEGPRRTAAVLGFYKLLVQFDPAAAVKAIGEIEDVPLQRLALDAAVNAAPGFALPLVAELALSLQDRITGKRDHLSDVVLEWALIDAPAVARFIDDHTDAFEDLSRGIRFFTTDQVVSAWAAIDPKATKEWIDRKEKWEDSYEIHGALVDGWYENDRAAAVSYTLAHAEEPRMSRAIGAIVRSLYYDSKEDATKFIQSLPEAKRQEALRDAFHNLILGVEEEGDTVLTQRAVASWMIEFPQAYWKGNVGWLFNATRPGVDDMLSWILQLPPALHESVAAEYSPPFWKSTSQAIMGVLQLADPSLREQLLRATLKNQHATLDEVRAAIANAPLSSEQKNHVLQILAAVEAEDHQDQDGKK